MAVERTTTITLDLKTLFIALSNYSSDIIPREGQVMDAVKGVDEVV